MIVGVLINWIVQVPEAPCPCSLQAWQLARLAGKLPLLVKLRLEFCMSVCVETVNHSLHRKCAAFLNFLSIRPQGGSNSTSR